MCLKKTILVALSLFSLIVFSYDQAETLTFGSSIYLSFGYLHRGNNNINIQENFLNINASVVFNDKWFVKRKFN